MRDGNSVDLKWLIFLWWFVILTAGCSSSQSSKKPNLASRNNNDSGSFYEVFGIRYYPLTSAKGFKQKGLASWYGPKFHGNRTSNGEIFDMYQMTAAHKRLPLPSSVKVTNLANGRQTIVRVNDRGPFVEGRIIDLSFAAARFLGFDQKGTEEVEIEVIDSPSESVGDPTISKFSEKIIYQLGAFKFKKNAIKLRDSVMVKLNDICSVEIIESNDDLFKVWLIFSGDTDLLVNPRSFFESKNISNFTRIY